MERGDGCGGVRRGIHLKVRPRHGGPWVGQETCGRGHKGHLLKFRCGGHGVLVDAHVIKMPRVDVALQGPVTPETKLKVVVEELRGIDVDDRRVEQGVVVNAFRGPHPPPRISFRHARPELHHKGILAGICAVGDAAALVPKRQRHAVCRGVALAQQQAARGQRVGIACGIHGRQRIRVA